METIPPADIGTFAESNQAGHLKEVTSKTSMRDLPFELLDSILLKSYLVLVLREKQELKNKDNDVISHLASVDFCWFQRIGRKKFKKELWRILVAYYEDVGKGVTIIRNNRNFLVKRVLSNAEFLDKLQSDNFLTDKKRLCLDKLQSDKEKNLELLLSLNFHDKNAYSCFVRCLQETNQHLAAKVLDNGGVVAEVKAICKKINDKKVLEQLILQLNGNRQNLFRENSKLNHCMKEIETAGLEILHLHQVRKGVTIFFWCKTKQALDWLKRGTESDFLKERLTQLFLHLSYSVTIRGITVDKKIFTKEVVFFSIVANFTSKLYVIENEKFNIKSYKEHVMGVTELRKEIHVLLSSRISPSVAPHCVIKVFANRIPFQHHKIIEIMKIEYPADIASIELENSLYVLDSRRCVWRIKEGRDKMKKTEKIIRWLDLEDNSLGPGTLSVTTDGHLLMVSRRKNDPLWSLMIFGGGGSEKAALRLSIQLPEDIRGPSHAVETSKGNFIILHKIKGKKQEERGSAVKKRYMEERITTISEVSGDGKTIIRRFIPGNEEQKLGRPSYSYGLYEQKLFGHLAVDSLDRVFLADLRNERVILLNSDLQWNRILIPMEKDGKERRLRMPRILFYDKEKKELIAGGDKDVLIYTLNRK